MRQLGHGYWLPVCRGVHSGRRHGMPCLAGRDSVESPPVTLNNETGLATDGAVCFKPRGPIEMVEREEAEE